MKNKKHIDKTQNRVRKDRGWEELRTISNQTLGTIKTLSHQTRILVATLEKEEVKEKVFTPEVHEKATLIANQVANDLLGYGKEAMELRNRHIDKTGALRNDGQVAEALGITVEYDNLKDHIVSLATENLADLNILVNHELDKPEVQDIVSQIRLMKEDLGK